MTRSIALGAAQAAVILWLLVHAALLALSWLANRNAPAESGGSLLFDGATLVLVPLLIGGLLLLDQRVTRERVFLGNLGVAWWTAPAAGAATALLLETLGLALLA